MFSYTLNKKDGSNEDKKIAAKYFKMSADKCESLAVSFYVDMLYSGDGIPVDEKEAARYIKMEADKGRIWGISKYAK